MRRHPADEAEYEDGEEYVMVKKKHMNWMLIFFAFNAVVGILRLATL